MLLLFKAAPAGVAAGTLGITFGLSGIAGTTGTADIHFGLSPITSIELNVFGTADIHFGLSGIPLGFLTRAGTVDTQLNLAGFGGFGDTRTVGIVLGLSGTIGTTLQGNGVLGINLGLSANGIPSGAGVLRTILGLTGTPTISGGTITPTGSVGISMDLVAIPVMVANALADLTLDLQGVGVLAIPFENQARTMRLSFSADEIRTFFRKG